MNINKLYNMKDFRNFYKSKNPYGMTVFDDIMVKGGMINPYILEERQLNVTQLDVFSRLMMDRIIFFGTEVNSDTCNIVNAQLLFLENTDPESPITMYINSPGGEVYSGLGVIDTMNFINPIVKTINTGMAASMGAMLLMCGEKGHRSALPHSRTMIHQPLGGTRGQASDIEIEAREILKLKDELYQIIKDCSGQDIEKIKSDADRDYWMTSQEALDYGLIDSIITKRAD